MSLEKIIPRRIRRRTEDFVLFQEDRKEKREANITSTTIDAICTDIETVFGTCKSAIFLHNTTTGFQLKELFQNIRRLIL
jgi:hypothetical protein